MKKLHLLLTALVTVAASVMTSSCSNADEPLPEPIPNEEGTTYEVSLNLAGEYTEVSEEPLSRAGEETPKKFYGVNVYCMKTDGSEDTYSHYAYGIFDDVADMTITLLGGYKYKFECTSVKDDGDKIYLDGPYSDTYEGTSYENAYKIGYPLTTSYNDYQFSFDFIGNRFITSTYSWLRCIQNGHSVVKLGDSSYGIKEDPSLDRFYGELTDFIPSSGAVATIPMKRTAFGIKIVVNGVPDGNLDWWIGYYFGSNHDECTGMEKQEFSQIYTFEKVYDCWKSEDVYTKDFTIYFTWTRVNGYEQYFEEKITVKRNVMTTITVNLKGGSNDITVGVNEDSTPMSNESVNVDYDGGDVSNIQVDPEE